MNHTYDPTFTVHPHSSVIFSHWEDKPEPQGATLKQLILAFAPDPAGLVTCKFHCPFGNVLPSATFTSFFCYIEISLFSRQSVLFGFPNY